MKIELFLILLTFFSLSFSLIAQNIKVVKEFNSSYYELKGLEVNLTSDKILIALDHQNIFTEDLSGKKIFYASFLAGGILLSIIIFNLGSLDIVFRDAAIFFSAAAAAVLHYKEAK